MALQIFLKILGLIHTYPDRFENASVYSFFYPFGDFLQAASLLTLVANKASPEFKRNRIKGYSEMTDI